MKQSEIIMTNVIETDFALVNKAKEVISTIQHDLVSDVDYVQGREFPPSDRRDFHYLLNFDDKDYVIRYANYDEAILSTYEDDTVVYTDEKLDEELFDEHNRYYRTSEKYEYVIYQKKHLHNFFTEIEVDRFNHYVYVMYQ